jgi:hypothetical protein
MQSSTGFGSGSLLNGMTHEPGICHARCPPWMVDCGGSCHMPGVTCSLQAIYLCPAVTPGGKNDFAQILLCKASRLEKVQVYKTLGS